VTFRRNLLSVLSSEARSISSLARELRVTPAEIEADLRHVIRTARAAGDQIVVLPARCRS
jgi:predicted Zn-ribbon and HTH transcriptional regulator